MSRARKTVGRKGPSKGPGKQPRRDASEPAAEDTHGAPADGAAAATPAEPVLEAGNLFESGNYNEYDGAGGDGDGDSDSGADGGLDADLIDRLASVIQDHQDEQAEAAAAAAAGDTQSSLGLGVDDQLLLDSLRSIIGHEEASSAPPSQQQQQQQPAAAAAAAAAPDAAAQMHDALMLARQMIQGQLAGQAAAQHASQPAAAGIAGGHHVDGGEHHHHPEYALPGSLGGPADAATLQAVQSVLQELGTVWSEEGPAGAAPVRRGDGTRARRRHEGLTPSERARIREDNRQRKRKWRDVNATRNKDNDLRARIQRRAALVFGASNTPAKLKWVEEEFQKRREKRLIRESSEAEAAGAAGGAGAAARSASQRMLAGDQLMRLFSRSNSILQGTMERVTAGLVPEHLVRTILVPSPERPPLLAGEGAPRRARLTYRHTAASVSLGFPPNLAKLASARIKSEL